MSWLKELDALWNEASQKAEALPKRVTIPDGEWPAIITFAEVDAEKPYIRFSLKFPDFENIVRTKVIFVTGKIEYVIRELGAIGIHVDSPADLPAAVRTAVGRVVMVQQRTQPGEKYSKYYFNSDTGKRVEVDNGHNIEGADSPENW